MKAYVISEPGGPDKLLLREIPIPRVKPGWTLLRVKAFGLNRSEWFTRNGDSPSVKFPRVLGIECVGEVVESLNSRFSVGQKVAALMGEMGRDFDGSYAEYVLVPDAIILPFESTLDWATLGALPEMLQTTHGSLYQGLEIVPGQTILIRGGTSSIGLCALEMARNKGLSVITTTRSTKKTEMLKSFGATHAFVDNGDLASSVRSLYAGGVDRVLELIGTSTLLDSLQCLRRGGIVCMTGILGGQWELEKFRPMEQIPTAVKLTSYTGEVSDISSEDFQKYLLDIESGLMRPPEIKQFAFSDLQSAHRMMDQNSANGKIVVTL